MLQAAWDPRDTPWSSICSMHRTNHASQLPSNVPPGSSTSSYCLRPAISLLASQALQSACSRTSRDGYSPRPSHAFSPVTFQQGFARRLKGKDIFEAIEPLRHGQLDHSGNRVPNQPRLAASPTPTHRSGRTNRDRTCPSRRGPTDRRRHR